MNKFRFWLTLLCAVVGVGSQTVAQVTTLDQISNNKVYTIRCGRGYMPNGDGVAQMYGTNNAENAAKWAFVKSTKLANTYYIYSADQSKFLKSGSQNTNVYSSTISGAFTLTENSGTFIIASAETTNWLQLGGGKQFTLTDATWKDKDSGNQWTLTEAGSFADETLVVQMVTDYEAIGDYIKIYNNLNTLGGLRATEWEKEDFKAAIDAVDATECQSIVESLETITLRNDKTYALETTRGNVIYYPAATADYAYSTGKDDGGDIDHTQPNQQWAILTTAKGKYLYNVGAEKFACDVETPDVTTNKGRVGLSASIATYDFDVVDNKANAEFYPWILKLGTHQFNVSNSYAQPVITFWNDEHDSGNQFRIVEVEDFDCTDVMQKIDQFENGEATVTINHQYNGTTFKTTIEKVEKGSTEAASWQPTPITNRVGLTATLPAAQTITSDITVNVPYTYNASQLPFAVSDLSTGFKNGTKFYTLKIRGTKNVVYDSSVNYAKNSTSEPGYNAAKYFAFTGDNVNGFKIYNLAAGPNKEFGPDGSTGAFTTDGQLLWLENNGGKNIFHAVGTENKYVNDNNSKLAYWVHNAGATDEGGNITFAVADADDLLKSAKMTFIGASEHVSTSGLVGDYTKLYVKGVNTIADQVEALSTLEDVLTYSGPTPPTVEYILPEAGNFYAIRDHRYDNYVDGSSFNAGTPSAMKGKVNHTAKSGNLTAGQIWYFDANMKGYCFATGFGLNKATEKAGVSDAQVFTFELKQDKTDMPKTFAVRVPMNGVNAHWYIWDQGNVNHGSVDRNGANYSAKNCQFYIERIYSLPVTISAFYYSSINLPVATVVPAGVEAWIAESEAEGKVTLKKIAANSDETSVLPANCAAILFSSTPATYQFDIINVTEPSTSIFSGTVAAIANPNDAMVLGKDDDGHVALYPYTGDYIPGFKMYYEGTSSQVRLDFDATTTAIEAAKRSDMREGEMYNINGQQVTKANGLVIVNGKKFVVK